ncbi:MAG TPA: DUF932 domain-containing protein [Flavisolibacter sp.]|nr:DUF932 domain-containing protein [Flavisolibacter sp.]
MGFNHWTKVRISDPQVVDLIQQALAPNKEVLKTLQDFRYYDVSKQFFRMCDQAFDYTMQAPTHQTSTTKGNLFGAYNGITGYFQNVRVYKTEEAKLKSTLFGGLAQGRTQKAFQFNPCICPDRESNDRCKNSSGNRSKSLMCSSSSVYIRS